MISNLQSAPLQTEPVSGYAAFDSETVYSKDYSVRDLGPTGYVNDPRFDCYLISIVCDDGFEWVGHPKDCPWEKLRNKGLLSANAGFDRAVLRRLIELGIAPAWVWPAVWHCTANMGVYFGLPRSLAGAVEQVFGVKVDKTIRDKDIKGKSWNNFGAELQAGVLRYALDDSRWVLKLWKEYGHLWPKTERIVSALTYSMGETGFTADADGLDAGIQLLERAKFEAAALIPWASESPILSPRALALQCRSVGIEPPKSLAKDSEECEAWEDAHGDKYPWVAAMRNWRRCNALVEKLKTARERIRPDGRMPFSLLYFGASTGRWSGAGGFNMQNLPRDPFYLNDRYALTTAKTDKSIDLRRQFKAAPGKKLVIADYRQIEARVTPWLAGDRATIKLVADGDARMKIEKGYDSSIYEIHARASMGWTGGILKKENPTIYQLAKARVLGLGFGCGWFKFIVLAKKMLDEKTFNAVFGKPVTAAETAQFVEYLLATDSKRRTYLPRWESDKMTQEERNTWVNSVLQVTDFPENNPKIVKLWKRLDDGLKNSAGGNYEVELPSGRVLRYFDVTRTGGQMKVRTTRGGHFTYAYGGLLTENLVQATARDILAEALVRLDEAGIRVVCHVHDEVICEVDMDFDPERIVELMTLNPSWARSLPLGAAYETSQFYLK